MTDDEILLLYKNIHEKMHRHQWYEIKIAFAREMELAGKRAAYEDAAKHSETFGAIGVAIRIRARAAEVCK